MSDTTRLNPLPVKPRPGKSPATAPDSSSVDAGSAEAEGAAEKPRWNLPHWASVLAGAAAAATSTLVGGQLGVAGTVAGAALASIVTTLALNLYDNTLRRAGHGVRTAAQRVKNVKPAELERRSVAGGKATAVFGAQQPSGQDQPSGKEPASGASRPRISRKMIIWTVITAVIGTVLGLGIMVGLERSTPAPITPGTSELAGTTEKPGADTPSNGDRTHDGSPGSGTTDSKGVNPNVAEPDTRRSPLDGAASTAPTARPSTAASTDTGTTQDNRQAPDPNTGNGLDGTTSDGTTSGSSSIGGTDAAGTTGDAGTITGR